MVHDAPTVRAQAYGLMQSSNPQQSTLEIGFSDPDPSVRRAALITAGNLGHGSAKAGLLAEFRKNPTGQTIIALLSVADDDIAVEIGRYALENPPHQALIASEFEELDTPKTLPPFNLSTPPRALVFWHSLRGIFGSPAGLS